MEFRDNSESPNGIDVMNSMNSSTWHTAIESYREQIKDDKDYHKVMETNSVEDLLKDAETIYSNIRYKSPVDFVQRLQPTLILVKNFSAVLNHCFGDDVTFAIITWGSIRLIISLASSRESIIDRVITMLEELASKLPKLKADMDNQLVTSSMKNTLINIYTEIICFYARFIRFFRSDSGFLAWPLAWKNICDDFSATINSMKCYTLTVDRRVEEFYQSTTNKQYGKVLEVMATMNQAASQDSDTVNTHIMPENLITKLWGREDTLAVIEKALEPGIKPHVLKSFALYGLGGVGKTKIAYRFAELNINSYDVIIWVASDNLAKMSKSFSRMEEMLWPGKGNRGEQNASNATMKVKQWLQKTDRNWLLVFDNADDIEVLRHAWPSFGCGSVIITTRDRCAAFDRVLNGEHVRSFDERDGSEVLLRSVGADQNSERNQEHAEAIIRAIGGLPLALSQISSVIRNSRVSLFEFLEEYKEDLLELSAHTKNADDYPHTLNTVWLTSTACLSSDSTSLLCLLSYFQPDAINESILVTGSIAVRNDTFLFLRNKWRRPAIMKELNQNCLVEKSIENNHISIHPLLQLVMATNQTDKERAKFFDMAVLMLSCGFPDTWSEDKGHQIEAWSGCEKCLPHVHHLISQRGKFNINVGDTQNYGELLLRCSWYLYERECYYIARSVVDAALNTFVNKNTLAYASAVDLSGLIMLDLNDPAEALIRFTEASSIRENAPSPADSLIASSLNNKALAYTELGQLGDANNAHEKAIQIRLTTKSDRIGNSYSNMASLLLRMGKADEAEEMLKKCPSLKKFTDETFLNTGNPRFSGDMVLLSRIRYEQGRLSDAVRLSSKALLFRQKLLGNRLKTCDSLYDVAFFTHRQGSITAPLESLVEMVQIAGSFPEGKGQLARAYFKTSTFYSEKEQTVESEASLEQAKRLRAEVRPELDEEPLTEESFRKLSPWMLW